MKLMKGILKVVLEFLLILTAAAVLFLALGVLGNRTALLTWLKNYEGMLPGKE